MSLKYNFGIKLGKKGFSLTKGWLALLRMHVVKGGSNLFGNTFGVNFAYARISNVGGQVT